MFQGYKYREGSQPENVIARLAHATRQAPQFDVFGTGQLTRKMLRVGPGGGMNTYAPRIQALAGSPIVAPIVTDPLTAQP